MGSQSPASGGLPKNDDEALANAMRRVIEDKTLAQTLVAGGRAAYEAQFTKAAFVRDSIAAYEVIMKAAP